MKREAIILLAAVVLISFCNRSSLAQTVETKRFEVGGQFSSLTINKSFETRTEPGFGGRFTYNLNENFALEAEGDFFPKRSFSGTFRTGGRALEGLFGVKIGKRYKKFGLFAKGRPGFISFSEGVVEIIPTGQTINNVPTFNIRVTRLTHFAADIGGVLEFYPTRRVFTRFDAGDTIIRYGQTTVNNFTATPGGTFVNSPFTVPGDTTHNFQFSAGVGFRF